MPIQFDVIHQGPAFANHEVKSEPNQRKTMLTLALMQITEKNNNNKKSFGTRQQPPLHKT